MSKHLPVEPSPEWFRENIHGIARRLKKGNDGQHSLLAGGAFRSFRFLPFYRDAFRVVVLGRTPDEVAQLNGWRFHSDAVHLNIRREIIAADLIQQFID